MSRLIWRAGGRCALLATAVLSLANAARAQLPPLQLSADSRQLQKGDKPFFWIADTAWDLYRLDPTEMNQYLANRRAKGFNVIQGPLMHTSNTNYAGVSNPNPSSPNAAWFTYMDQIIDAAAAHGLYIAPVLSWGTTANQFNATTAFNFGQFIGNRYRLKTNIAVFIVAAEYSFPEHVSPHNLPVWDPMAAGLIAGLNGQARLLTMHPQACCNPWGGQTTADWAHDRTWMSFNMVQSAHYGNCGNDTNHLYYLGTHNWKLIESDWARNNPVKPTFDGEGGYEDIPTLPGCADNPPRWNAFGVRRRAYWSVIAGGFGYTYGGNGVFQFNQVDQPINDWDPNSTWIPGMEFPGAVSMSHLKRLMYSRPIPGRTPNQLLLISPTPAQNVNQPVHIQATLGGPGPAPGNGARSGGARSGSGEGGGPSFAFIYVPEANKTFTVDMDLIAGDAHRFWWWNPSNNQATLIGEHVRADYAPNGGIAFTTAATGDDFVLVIDDIAANYSAPGAVPLWPLGEVTGDEHVNVNDLLAVISAWGPCAPAPAPCLADIAPPDVGDDQVNVNDLLQVIGNWGG